MTQLEFQVFLDLLRAALGTEDEDGTKRLAPEQERIFSLFAMLPMISAEDFLSLWLNDAISV
jgi:hypothetical protein